MNTSSHQGRKSEAGLSLIELFFIIALVAILSGFLFTALNSAKESSRSAKCLSNMRQIGLGLVNYSKDHNNFLPPISLNSASKKQTNAWAYAAWSYFNIDTNQFNMLRTSKTETIFSCPQSVKKVIYVPGASGANDYTNSYGMPSDPLVAAYPTVARPEEMPLNLLTIAIPADTAMVVEDSTYFTNSNSWRRVNGFIPHRRGSNILYYDGHVDHRQLNQIPTSGRFWDGR